MEYIRFTCFEKNLRALIDQMYVEINCMRSICDVNFVGFY